MSIIRSIKGYLGQMIHYKDGRKIGESWPGLHEGSQTHYDADGRRIGRTDRGILADSVHRDAQGRRVGETRTDDNGVSRHDDRNGRAGMSYDDPIGRTTRLDDRPAQSGASAPESGKGGSELDRYLEESHRQIRKEQAGSLTGSFLSPYSKNTKL
ncbi:MAG: hypothetical protein J6K32_03615 [Clostridia bacterium]|nr:hypothetical protein [Clostridia bacterium]